MYIHIYVFLNKYITRVLKQISGIFVQRSLIFVSNEDKNQSGQSIYNIHENDNTDYTNVKIQH